MDRELKAQIAEFCQKHHITRMMSYIYPFHKAEDKDHVMNFLVDFEEGHSPGYFDLSGGPGLIGMEEELAEILGKKYAYIGTFKGRSRYLRTKPLDDAQAKAQMVYQAPKTT